MRRVALIGGIGSGKSEVLAVARQMGIACVGADEINARLCCDPQYIALIDKHFDGVVKDGAIDKAALADRIYSSNQARLTLNSLAHPLILQQIKEDKTSQVVELPLVVGNCLDDFDFVVFVKTPLEVRLQRLQQGRGMSRERAMQIVAAQPPSEQLEVLATHILDNGASKQQLVQSSAKLFEQLLLKK